MGLITGFLTGAVIGIGLIGAWCHYMQYRSNKRITKAVDINLLGFLNRDDLMKLCGDNFPPWISFPVYEQVKWMNKMLSKMWPFVAEAATAVIKESVEPLLEDYRPPAISSLKFSKLSLGTVAPKIEGIRVQNLKKGQITMDIDFRWGGDPSIILAVEAAVVSIPIQLKDLQVFTVVRVIFQLSEEIPCISAFVVALLSEPKPKIDYTLKAVGGSLTALPGISDMIDDTVDTIITDMLQWPHRIVVPLGGVPVDTSDLELKPEGKLTVTIVKANDLKNMEMIGKSDPYVTVFIRALFKVKTKTIDNNLNPVWGQTFELIAEDKETQSLIIEVFDEDVGDDKRLGIAKLPLINLESETPKEIELRLLPSLDMLKIKDKKDRGTVTIKASREEPCQVATAEKALEASTAVTLSLNHYKSVFYHHFNKEEQFEALEAEKNIIEGRKKLKEAGVIGSTVDALDGTVSLVGTGIGKVGTGIGNGIGTVGTGIGTGIGTVGTGIGSGVGMVGTGIGSGVGMVGNGLGTGVGMVASGFGAMGSSLSKAGKFMGKGLTSTSKRTGSNSPTISALDQGNAKLE